MSSGLCRHARQCGDWQLQRCAKIAVSYPAGCPPACTLHTMCTAAHPRTWYPVSLASMEGQKGMMPRERRSTYSSAAAMTEGRQLRKAMSVSESDT